MVACLGRFLFPIRTAFLSLSHPNPCLPLSRKPCAVFGKSEQLNTWVKGVKGLELESHIHASVFCSKLSMQRKCLQNLFCTGRKISAGSFLGLSVVAGALKLSPTDAHAMAGNDFLPDEFHADLREASGCLEEDPYTFWAFARKWWLPFLLVLTVVASWENPVTLAIRVALFLMSTKPSHSSIYLFIEKFRRQSLHQNPRLYRLKYFYARKVEVDDYTLLCLARVEFRDRKVTLIGIFGGWWILQHVVEPSLLLNMTSEGSVRNQDN